MTIGIHMAQSTRILQAGKFKAQCLHLMDEVHEKHISITITKHGKPVAKLVPVDEQEEDFFGLLQGTVTIQGDILAPLDVKWEAEE
jgi:prevent-host-death family protein